MLLKNAVEHSSGGDIKVELSCVQHAKKESEYQIFVVVSNLTKNGRTGEDFDKICSGQGDIECTEIKIIKHLARTMGGDISIRVKEEGKLREVI